MRTRDALDEIDRWGFGVGTSVVLLQFLKAEGGYEYHYRKRGEDFLKEAPQLLQDYEAQHGKVLRERYSPEEWDWFRQAAD